MYGPWGQFLHILLSFSMLLRRNHHTLGSLSSLSMKLITRTWYFMLLLGTWSHDEATLSITFICLFYMDLVFTPVRDSILIISPSCLFPYYSWCLTSKPWLEGVFDQWLSKETQREYKALSLAWPIVSIKVFVLSHDCFWFTVQFLHLLAILVGKSWS